MVDPRNQVAEEFCRQVFDALFVRPRDWTDSQAEAHVLATVEAIRPVLPRSRSEGLAVVQRAGTALKVEARTNAWPTTREVVIAVRAVRREIEGQSRPEGDAGWPHRNSDLIVETARKSVREKGAWPEWMQMEHPDAVADALLSEGFNANELMRAGYRKRRERAA